MYALIFITPDYSNIKFITHPEPAMEEFNQEVEDVKSQTDGYCRGICLIHIKGDGVFQIGQGFDEFENIDMLGKWEPEE